MTPPVCADTRPLLADALAGTIVAVDAGWPRVERMRAADLIEQVNARSDLRLRLVGRLPGGEVGAALVTLPSGARAVLSSWPGRRGAQVSAVGEIIDRLRARDYPAPAYFAVIDCGDATAVVQEFVEGEPAHDVGVSLVQSLLTLNGVQRGALATPGGSVADLYLDQDGPGYCLHEPLRRASKRSAALAERVREIASGVPADVFAGTDAVHGDFHPGNVLVAAGSPDVVAGVVDWTGAQAGDCGLDLVTLSFSLDHDVAAPAARVLVRDRIAVDVDSHALLAFTAHLALRQVDWAIRHHGTAEADRWADIADDWFRWATRAF